jgi:hypothetical protein
MDKEKTPKELAINELNKKLGKEIAKRMLEIKKHNAEIRRLEKEIVKIENGELVPNCEDEEASYIKKNQSSISSSISLTPLPYKNYYTNTTTSIR